MTEEENRDRGRKAAGEREKREKREKRRKKLGEEKREKTRKKLRGREEREEWVTGTSIFQTTTVAIFKSCGRSCED